mgnify:CR=1 FL=1
MTVGQLEASYPAYCKALRMLVRDGASLAKVQRTLCWERLSVLHTSLPRHYRDPAQLFFNLQRELRDQQAPSVNQPQLNAGS